MKLNKLWIPALILFLIGGSAKICDTVFNVGGGDSFFLSSSVCNWILAGSAALLFVIGFVLGIADKKKNYNAEPRKNVALGIFGFISSVMIIGYGVVSLLSGDSSRIVESLFSIAGGIVLLYESSISVTGHNGMKKAPVVALLVPIWCCIRFFSLFLSYNQKSLKSMELFDIIAVAFLVMFLFYQAMLFAGINNKLAARKIIFYGTCYIMLGLIATADLLIKMTFTHDLTSNIDTEIVAPTITNIMRFAGDIALCVYAFLMIRDVKKSIKETFTTEPEEEEEDLFLNTDGLEVEPSESEEKTDTEKKDEIPETAAEEEAAVAETEEKPEEKPEKKPKPLRDDSKRIAEELEKANAEARMRAGAKAKAKAEAKAKADAEDKAKAKAEVEAKAKTESEANKEDKVKAEAKAKAKSEKLDEASVMSKVAEPAKLSDDGNKEAYDELVKMLDEL